MSDAYLLDTSIASIAWDGGSRYHTIVRQRLATLGESSISVCVISLAEVEYGLQTSPGIDRERHNAIRRAMLEYQIWDINRHTAEVYGSLRGELFKRYAPRDKRGRLTKKWPEELRDETSAKELGIQENDLWIVSVAVQYDLRLVTKDQKMQRIFDVAKDVRADIWILSPSGEND